MALPPDVAKLTEVVRKKTMDTLKEEGDRYVSPVFLCFCFVMTISCYSAHSDVFDNVEKARTYSDTTLHCKLI